MRSIEARKYCSGQSRRRTTTTCLGAVAELKGQGVSVALAGNQAQPDRLGKEQYDVLLDAGERLGHDVLAAGGQLSRRTAPHLTTGVESCAPTPPRKREGRTIRSGCSEPV